MFMNMYIQRLRLGKQRTAREKFSVDQKRG